MAHNGVASPAAFSPDEKYIITQSQDGATRFWQRGKARPVRQLVSKDSAAGANGYGYIGKNRFITQSWKTGLLTLWDLDTAKPIAEWLNGHGFSNTLSMHPDGRHFITVGANQTVKIWETETRKGIDFLERAGFATYSPDGKMFATGGSDGYVRLWDSTTHQLLLELPGHSGMISFVSFSKDQKMLASAGFDGTVQVYTLDPVRLLQVAKAHLTGSLTTAECERYLGSPKCPDTRKALDEAIARARF
jgi:WD40 repeat protein